MVNSLINVALLMATLQAPHQALRIRTVPYAVRTQIRDLIRPNDEIVEIVRGDELVSESVGDLSPQELMSYLTSEADVVAVVNVESVAGILVEDGTWIHTQVAGVIKNVLKDQNRPLRVGSSLRFEFAGGQISVGSVLVRTAGPQPTVEVGRAYLVFAGVNVGDGRLYPRHVPVLIDGDTLVSKGPSSTGSASSRDPLDGFSLQRLLEQVRRSTK